MDNVKIIPAQGIGKDFIGPEFIPEGKDEWYLRNEQFSKSKKAYRRLRPHEVETLVKNGNYCEEWDDC